MNQFLWMLQFALLSICLGLLLYPNVFRFPHPHCFMADC